LGVPLLDAVGAGGESECDECLLATIAAVPTAAAGTATFVALLPAAQATRALRNVHAADEALEAALAARCFLLLLLRRERVAMQKRYPAAAGSTPRSQSAV
jgi:hypothetical protein